MGHMPCHGQARARVGVWSCGGSLGPSLPSRRSLCHRFLVPGIVRGPRSNLALLARGRGTRHGGSCLEVGLLVDFAMAVGRTCAPRPCECPGGSKDLPGPLQSGATCSHAPPYVRRVPRCRLTFQTFCREHGCWSPRAETPLDFHLRLLNLKFIPPVARVMESLPL